MTAPTRYEQVLAFGTGYLTTRILRDGPHYLWCRAPGPARTGGFTPVPATARRALAALPPHGARVVLGEDTPTEPEQDTAARPGDNPADAATERRYRAGSAYSPAHVPGTDRVAPAGEDTPMEPGQEAAARAGGNAATERRYRADAAYSLGHVLGNHRAAPDQWAALPRLLRQVGRTLRTVHEQVPASAAAGAPRGTLRLAGWLAGRPGPGQAGRLHREAHARLGRDRLARAAQWCAALNTPGERDVFLLGGAALGAMVPDPSGTGCLIMAGEELARGPAAYDLGWTLGELAEFRLLHFAAGNDEAAAAAAHCAEASGALLDGYGAAGTDRAEVARAAVLRVLLHTHDYAAFVDWTDQLTQYLDLLADLIDHPLAAVGDFPDAPAGHRQTHQPEEQ
ncbi:hypothetical protein [Streptomyces sp. NPDC017435]|uniref:hypothetical protein n=1 Tax=Streptomyces sp. NPDC017435 TaxID=3364995 RepID=UPI003787B5D1